MSAVLIVITCIGAVAGAAVGFFKKFTALSTGGAVVLLTFLLQKAIGSGSKGDGYGLTLIIATLVILVLFTVIAESLKKAFKRVVDSKVKLSHYKNRDEMEENDALIMNAVDNGDKKQYKKQLKARRKIKDSAGGWGIVNSVLGAVFGCVNVLVTLGVIICVIVMFADFSQIAFLTDLFSVPLASASWAGLGRSVALDMSLIAVLGACIRSGYKNGISTALCFVVILALAIGFIVASWSIANSNMCAPAVDALKNGLLSSFNLGDVSTVLAKVIIAAIIFLLSLIPIILIGVFLPKLLVKLRDTKAFCAVDGTIGAVVICGVTFALLLVIGGVAYTLNDLPFMETLNLYEQSSCFADALYSCNPLNSSFASLPVRGWFDYIETQPAA